MKKWKKKLNENQIPFAIRHWKNEWEIYFKKNKLITN